MNKISAAENITIEIDDDRWRMIANGKDSPTPQTMLEAAAGHPLSYVMDFASTRRLPKSGSLPVEAIQRIVLGWSPGDESWHLGLLLDSDLAQTRGSRWCEIARWPDPSTTVFHDVASQAGRSLAHVVTRPFHLVAPRPEDIPIPEAPPRDLPELPLALNDLWTLEKTGKGILEFTRARHWAWTTARRVVWYAFWTVIYFLLVYLTFTAGIAPSTPAFLPYLGIFAGFVMIFLTVKNIYLLTREPDRIIIDARQRQVRGQRGEAVRWAYRAGEIDSVYVSQVVGKRRGKGTSTHFGELNLHLSGEKFQFLTASEDITEYDYVMDSVEDSVMALTRPEFTTNIQAAALYIGEALGLPVWYDRRAG